MLKTVPNFGQIIYVYDAFARLVSEYAAGNEPSACHTCYLGTDHLGSTRIVTDETRAVVGRHDFMPFGEEIGANQGGRAGATITSTRQPTIFSFNGSGSPSVGISGGVGGLGGSISGSPTSESVSVRAGLAGGLRTFGGVSITRVLPLVCQ